MSKSFPDHIAKHFHIYKWIFFAILTFVIIEEMASGLGTTTTVCKSTVECSFFLASIQLKLMQYDTYIFLHSLHSYLTLAIHQFVGPFFFCGTVIISAGFWTWQ